MLEPMNEAHIAWSYKLTTCPSCKESVIMIGLAEPGSPGCDGLYFLSEHLVYPFSIQRIKISDAVPEYIQQDYREACGILDRSPKASAAMARRVLQSVLREQGYVFDRLYEQINDVLNESGSDRTLPEALKRKVDAVRNVGNMSAHPFEAADGTGIIDVSQGDADFCLDIVGEVILHYYTDRTEVEEKIADIDKKLDKADKKPIRRPDRSK